MNENLRQCNIIGGVFYKNDLIKGKRGYESFVGQYLNIYTRKTNMEEKRKRNFWLMMFPYILLIIGFSMYGVMMLIARKNDESKALAVISLIYFVCTNAAGIMIFVSAILFMKDNGLASYVGDPEAVLRETKGTVDFDSGKIYATTKDYDVYSGNQWAKIIGNIIKFFACLFLMAFFGWLVYIIYRLRLKQVIKLYNEYESRRQELSGNQITSMLLCTSDRDIVEGCTLYFEDGKYLEDKVNYVGTFYYKNVIYAAFETEEDDTPIVVQIDEGFNHFIIEDNEKTSRLVDIYNSLVE